MSTIELRNARDEHINWALEYVINSSTKIPQLLKIRAARALSALVWPEEIVPGLLDKLWSTGAALRILNMARQAEIEVHKHINITDFEIEHAIGQGAVGKVYSAIYRENSVAVKTCSESNPAFNEEEFRFEVALMCILRHPNILTCIGANTSEFFFISPYQCHGTLRSVLDSGLTLSALRRLSIAYQIACGMNYLHKYHFIHRDLKSDNILLDECWNVKVNDFGTSRLHGIIDFTRKDNMIGTLGTFPSLYSFLPFPRLIIFETEWMAPEMYEENFEYDEKVDVYSFGIVLYEIFTGKYPYYEIEKKYQIGDHVLNGGRPIFANEEIAFDRIRVLMKRCWHSKPSKRPSFQSIEEKLSSLLSLVKERESGMRRKKQQFNLVNTLRRVTVNFDIRRKPEPLNNNLQVVNSGLGLPSLDQFQPTPTPVGIGIAPSKSY